MSGNGAFSANGGGLFFGSYYAGSGGGGRIALYYKSSSFSGTTEAKGGCGSYSYPVMVCAQDGTIHIVDESIIVEPEPEPEPEPIPDPIPDPVPDPIPDPIPEPEPDPIPDPVPDPEPDPVPDTTPPSIASYTFDEIVGDITTNPLLNPVSLFFTASENVNWISLKIEKEDDSSLYKYFYPGADCDEKNTCAKDWNGLLSSGGLLQSGVYKIKLHIKDLAENEYDDYLSPYMITVDISEDISEDTLPALE